MIELSRANALSDAAPPRGARQAISVIFFFNGALFAGWVSRIPTIQVERSLSDGALGLALLGMAMGALVSMPLAGWCSARCGSDRVCRWAAGLYGVLLPLLALAPDRLWLTLALLTFGAVHGGLDVAMNAQAVEAEARYQRPIMASFHALFSAGGLVGAALGGGLATLGLAPLWHFVLAALVWGVPTVVVALPRLIPPTEVESPVTMGQAGPRFAWPKGNLLTLGLVAFSALMCEGAMADWTGVFLREVTRASDGLAATGYAAFSIAMAIGRVFGDGLSAKFGPMTMVRGGGALAALGLLAALLTGHSLVALAGFACVGAGFATVIPLIFSATGRLPRVDPSLAMATVTTLGYMGLLLGPPCIGLVSEWVGLRMALGIIVGASLLVSALAPILKERREIA